MPFGLTPLLIQISADVGGAISGLQSVKNQVSGLKDVAKTAAGVLLGELAHDALGAVTSAAGQASENFMDYESTLTKIIAATGATGEEMEELRRSLSEVSEAQTDLGFTAAQSAAGLEALIKAGMTGEEATEALRAALSLARLEGISTETAAGLLVQTLTMFSKQASESAEALDSVSKAADAGIDTAIGYANGLANCGAAASNMGLGLEETLAALIQLDKTYGSATESGTFLNAMFKDLVKKSDDLGISLYKAAGSMRSLDNIVAQIRAKVQGFGDDQAAVNEYLSVFDVRAQRAVLGLLNYDGSIVDTMATMEEARSVQDKVNLVMETTAGTMARVNAQQQNASMGFGQLASQLQVTWQSFTAGLGPIGQVANSLGPSLLQGAMSGLMMMLPGMIGSLGGVSGAMHAVGVASHAMLGPIGLVIGAITLFATAYATNFMGFKDAVDAAVGWVIEKLGWLKDALFGAAEAAKNALGGFADWVKGGLDSANKSIQGFVNSICFAHAIHDAVESSKKDLSEFVDTVDSSMKGALGGIEKFAPSIGAPIPAIGGIAGQPVSLSITGPLVNIEGSADEKTAELAAERMREELKSVLIEATSGQATTKRIRDIGRMLNVA